MADILKQVSDELAGVAEQVGRSVARVEARRRLPASGVAWGDDLIVTAHHIVEREESIRIGTADGNTLEASLIGRDPGTDIAVLRVKSGALPAVQWADADSLKVGHLVLALGRPMQQVQATLGVVSAIGSFNPEEGRGRRERRWAERTGRLDHFIQTDVTMYPGFSGGPLVDAAGQVRGINTSGFMRGISLTIPTQAIRSVVDQLVKHGKVKQGYIGVGLQPARLPEALAKQLNQETALLLLSVEPGSPADQAGLVLGDVIVRFNNVPTENVEELLSGLRGELIGQEIPITLVRAGQVHDLKIVVAERK
jgi:S1-C subfamily serine protease